MKRLLIVVVAALAIGRTASAQDPTGSTGPMSGARPGWTLTPSMGFGETYDDNISLFGVRTADDANNDYVQSWFPGVNLHYEGRHTDFNAGYSGSFIAYRTFSALNRWGQNGHLNMKRKENARIEWSAAANLLTVPTTDLVDVGGLPFRRTGATTSDGRGGFTYLVSARDSFSVNAGFQYIDFDRPLTDDGIIHGGHVFETGGGWRHKLNSRLGVGADYAFRRALVVGTAQPFDLHSIQAAADYEINSLWLLSASAGVVSLAANDIAESRQGPAFRVMLERRRAGRSLQAAFLQSYIPSFGFGGAIRNQEATLALHMPLFHSRRFYTEQTLIYRDDDPLTTTFQQLPLRSLRTLSLFGWAPQQWVRLEAFYARTQQTNFGQVSTGQLYRNRIGFQIVTSKPVRME